MHQPLIILSPPRSFSSVVSTMIGEHPQLYGFPELLLFSGETIEEVMYNEQKARRQKSGPPGLLRALAQEHDGAQTTNTIVRAINWLNERKHWSTKKLFDYLLDLVSPRIGLDKSPLTISKSRYMERAYQMYPQAFFLHLTRHPVATRNSVHELRDTQEWQKDRKSSTLQYSVDYLSVWLLRHRSILNFTDSLPVGQTMRIRGEDVLSYPDTFLPQIAQWMGLRTDSEAIEAMKHPENSPYACVPPAPIFGGNDPKFIRNPQLRFGKVKEPSLKSFLQTETWEWIAEDIRNLFQENHFNLTSTQELTTEITKLAHLMGYQ